jgi:class 3 adenylate cyclase/tetratricopeptide (TPR) repeat protein
VTDLRRHVPPVALRWDSEAPGTKGRVVDGTLVFADVSGFTALTERLSRRGRIGAEEIVDTLNRVFSPMLRISAARGGELLKFGGDALLFLFRGPAHPEQACDAAVEMRTALRESAGIRTSVGRLSLSMSVGVHSGDVHLFLVGSPTRELLILGPGASATADAEKLAEAGEIVVTAQTAARLSAGSTRPREDGALLLRRRTAHTEPCGAAEPPPGDPALLATLFPHELGAHLAEGPPDPEHRIATIAFIRFSGTDEVLAEEGVEELGERLHRLVSVVEDALAPEDVTLLATDLDTDGGKFFLGSGVPFTREDDEGRMVRALRRVADADVPFPVQLGANRGHVFAAELGVPERAAYSSMGDTTNTAARIMAKAPPGSLYVHPAVLEHSRTTFQVTPAGPFAMKGKSVPLLVHDVGEETGTREVAAEERLPFIGRETQVQMVAEVLTRALEGAGGVVVVDGATGMGKSRLVHEALALAPEAQVSVLRGEPYGLTSTYRVLRDPVRGLLGIERDTPERMGEVLRSRLREVAPELLPFAPLLADVAQVSVPSTPQVDRIDPKFRADRVADAVIELVGRLVTGPFVLVVEEAHWADGASAHLLERVSTATAGRPWAVVCVRRGRDGGFLPENGSTVTLGPLSPEALEQLVIAATENAPLRPHEVQAIVERADGNPLYVEEVTRMTRGTGSVDLLPESLQAAMGAQIDRLSPVSRRVLRYAAVLGRSFRREIVDATLRADGLDVDAVTYDDLAAFLEPDGPHRIQFRNSLVRDAAYEGLAFKVRSRLHQTAGEVLERLSTDLDVDSPTLALHFSRAGDAQRTWRYAQLAGRLAERSYANADAADLLESAVEVSRRVPDVADTDRAELWTRIGSLRELAGMFEGSLDAYRRAERLLRDDPLSLAKVLEQRATVHTRTGALTAATRAVARARRLLDGLDGDGRGTVVRLDGLTARIRVEQERLSDALVWSERAAEGARATGDSESLVLALVHLDTVEMIMGVPGLGARHLEALQICIDEGLRPLEEVVRGNLGTLAYFAGRWTEAAEWYTTAREVALEVGKDFGAAETGVNLAELLINQGRLADAEAVLTDALRVLRASGAAFFIGVGEVQMARVLLLRGDHLAAAELGAATARRLLELDKATSALEASLVQADALIREGRPEQALATIDAAERAASDEAAQALPRICLQRSRALLALGRFGEADELVSTGIIAARETGVPYDEALLLRVLSRVRRHAGDDEGAVRAREEAEEILGSLGARTVTYVGDEVATAV